jgi:DNA-binding transcriptional regulator LsrR (DeoR family)
MSRISPDDSELLIRASRLYYMEDRKQEEIAELLRISRPGVSRLLQRAREEKVVEIRIRESNAEDDWSSIERGLRLKQLFVAAESGIQAVGQLAARFFARTVRKGDVIGLTAGTTLSAFVHSVNMSRALDLEIIPLAGALWETGEDFDGSFLCQELRHRTGGTHRVLSAPAVVRDAKMGSSLRAEPRVRSVIERYSALRCAFFGIGVASEDHPVALAAKSPSSGKRGLPKGAVASIGCLFFDAKGRACRSALDRRTIGISSDELQAVPLRVGLAAGEEKLEATLASAQGGIVDVLIVDATLARKLRSRLR